MLHAICPPCGDTLQAEPDVDWTSGAFMRLPILSRPADNFGAGWAELDQGAALNNSGKRWGAAAEAMFAKGLRPSHLHRCRRA